MGAAKQNQPSAAGQRNWLLLALAMAAVVLFVLSGCATIPTSGPVGKSEPLPPRSNSVNVNFQQFSPVDGATPDSIIRGFIESGTGVNDDFQVARQYLTPDLAQSWSPDKRTLVYTDAFSVVPGAAKASYDVTFEVVSTVDGTGVLTPAKQGTTERLGLQLAQVEGQWRISKAPDGLVLAEANFQTLFSPFSLYFYDPSFTYGVPDVRWLAGRSTRTSTSIVKAMLGGPAPYLKGAVVSAFPNGIALERDSVPVADGVARIGLTAAQLLDTSVKQRQQMRAQMLTTLQKALNTVTEVKFLADEREIDMGGPVDIANPMIVENAVPATQVALAKNELVTFDGTKIAPIPNMVSVQELAPAVPAVSYSGDIFAFRAGAGNQIYSVVPGQQPALAIAGVALTPPSFAPNGWLWSAAGDGSGAVIAIKPDGAGALGVPVVMTVPWLVGQDVTTLRISRDGTRALVISESNGVSRVSITGLFKTGEVPSDLNEPLGLVHTGSPTLGVWTGESSVAVAAPSATEPVTIEILDPSRGPVEMEELAGVEWISAGSGVRNVHAQTGSEFYSNVGNSWAVAAKSLSQASFAG